MYIKMKFYESGPIFCGDKEEMLQLFNTENITDNTHWS